MKSARTGAFVALILLVILVVWVSLYVMADKTTTYPTPTPIPSADQG